MNTSIMLHSRDHKDYADQSFQKIIYIQELDFHIRQDSDMVYHSVLLFLDSSKVEGNYLGIW